MIIKCPICDIEYYKVLYKSNLDYNENEKDKVKQFVYASGSKKLGRIVKCEKCGLIYVNPQEENIEKLYEKTEDENYEKSKESRAITFKRDIEYIEKFEKRGKILDMGCSSGIFLEVAKNNGWDIYGTELSEWGYKKAKKITPNIFNKKLGDCNIKNDFFDVVTMWDLIEHLTNPNEELERVYKILKKNGLLVLSTPNIGSCFSKIMGIKWLNIIRMHIFYFDKKTIKKILEKNGFKVIKIKSYPRTIILKYAIEWLKPYKKIYKTMEFIKNSKIGELKITVNFMDSMIVFARKI